MLALQENEFAPYQQPYLDAVENKDKGIIENLEDSLEKLLQLLKNLPKEKQLYNYAEDKWTIKELIQHIIDCERVFAYRTLCFARKDKTHLPGFEQDDYMANYDSNSRIFEDLINEFVFVRNSTILMFKSFDAEILKSLGIASGYSQSVRALGYIIAGHQLHHTNIIKERYL